MKNTLKIIFVIIGTLIGAGFASGKEIYTFFAQYGFYGIIGIIISTIIISIVIYKTLLILLNSNIKTYDLFSQKIIKNIKTKKILKIIIDIFLIISFYVMVAGFSAYLYQEFEIPNIIGTIIMIIICYITFLGNIKMIVKINMILTPIIIISILTLFFKNIEIIFNIELTGERLLNSMLKAILYASYNSIMLIPMLVSLKEYIINKKQVKYITIITNIIIIALAITIYGLLLQIDINVKKIELPMIYVVGQFGKSFKYIYGAIILIAIYTSAISAGYGILENYINQPEKYKKIAIIICLSSILVSQIGFSNLVNLLYPIFGVLGLIQILKIIQYKINN